MNAFTRWKTQNPTAYLAQRLANSLPPAPPATDPMAAFLAADAAYKEARADYWRDRDPLTGKKIAPAPEPESETDSWAEAVAAALDKALAAFAGNEAVLSRLAAAIPLAKARDWTEVGDAARSWQMGDHKVNGRCDCGDYQFRFAEHGGWCKHRLARALAVRATEMAGDVAASPAPVPEGTNDTFDSITNLDLVQIESIAPLWGGQPGTMLTYSDRHEQRDDVCYSDLLPIVAAAGWHEAITNLGLYLNPAFDARREAEETALKAKWETYYTAHDSALPAQPPRGRAKLFKS